MTEFGFSSLINYLMIGAALFALGLLGLLSRRNLIVMFLSAEMTLQGVALTLVAFGRYHGNWTGQVFTIVILTVAACEAGIALALILILFKQRESLDISLWKELRETNVPPIAEDPAQEAEPIEVVAGPDSYPRLTPAGVEPSHRGPGIGMEVGADSGGGRGWEARRG